jgi:polar amino acid transport system substrate-binding protein
MNLYKIIGTFVGHTRHLIVVFSIALYFFTASGQTSIAQNLVRVCDDISQWAPYSYSPEPAAGIDPSKRIGSMIEFLAEIFEFIELEYTLEVSSWARCTIFVEEYSKYEKYEIFINGAYTEERFKKYLITKPIYSTHQGVFFSTKKFLTKPDIDSPEDLTKYKICGVRANDYTNIGLSDDEIFTRGKTIKEVLLMLSAGRCEIVVSSMEPVYGSILTGNSIIPSDVSSFLLPNIANPTFNIFISKESPRGKVLLEKINHAITTLQERGVWDRINEKYEALLQAN